MEFLSFIKTSFQILCLIATLFFMVMWMQTFLLDEDTTTIENRSFFKTENDKLPVLSMCFEQSFEHISFPEPGEGVDIAHYKDHLGGKYFDKRFTGIDYYTVSMNISEFIIGYDVGFLNGTRFKHSNHNVSFNRPYHTYSFASWGRIVKCFGLEITDSEVAGIAIHFKRDIFPTKVFGSVEKLPGEKPVPDNAIKGKHSTNCNDREAKENNQGATNDDEQGRHRTYSLGEKGLKINGSSTKNGVTPPISNNRPGYNHASSTGTTRAVVGTCNENFFKQPPKKAAVKDSPPINNTVSQTAKVKQRRFRVESSDR